MGWVDNVLDWMSAADRLVTTAGNTTVHQAAAAAKPWIVVPEWRYFAEQLHKARSLDQAGAAVMAEHWPASADEWRGLWERADRLDPETQAALVDADAAANAAQDIERMIESAWSLLPRHVNPASSQSAKANA